MSLHKLQLFPNIWFLVKQGTLQADQSASLQTTPEQSVCLLSTCVWRRSIDNTFTPNICIYICFPHFSLLKTVHTAFSLNAKCAWQWEGVFIQTVSTHLLASGLDHAPTINKPLWSSFGSTTKATSSKLVLVVSSVPECESAKLTSIQMNPTSLSISLYVVLKSIISSFSPTTP